MLLCSVKASRKQRVVLEGRIHLWRATGVLTGSCVCMPVVGCLHGRYLENNNIESIPAGAFTTLVNLKHLYVPPFSVPPVVLCRAGLQQGMSICIAKVVM